MRRSIKNTILFLILLLSQTIPLSSQASTVTITGSLKDSTIRKPLANASVSLPIGTNNYKTQTDSLGLYSLSFDIIQPAYSMIRFYKSGYIPAGQYIQLDPGQTYTIDYLLRDSLAPTLYHVVINNDASWTNNPQVRVLLPASDTGSGLYLMSFSSDGNTYDSPEPYSVNLTYSLTQGDGPKTIYAKVRDRAGNWSTPASSIITLDTSIPTISISVPSANSTISSSVVYGTVSEDIQTVTVNDIAADVIPVKTGIQTAFIAKPTLTEGINTLTVKAYDKAGNLSQSQITTTYNTLTPKTAITYPFDDSEINISPIKIEGLLSNDIEYITVSDTIGYIYRDKGRFKAEGIRLEPGWTIVTAKGYDKANNLFESSIVITSPELFHYQIVESTPSIGEFEDNRPSAGSTIPLKITLNKNNLPAQNEEIQFNIITPLPNEEGSLPANALWRGVREKVIPQSVYTDANGEAAATLTTDTNSSNGNQIECFLSSNPLVKTSFYFYTKPAAPSILTKITDDSITPVPGASIDLIVKLTDQYNNPIPNETINFQITQGTGVIASPEGAKQSLSVAANFYGEARVNLTCPNSASTLTQIQASSQTVPSVTAAFNITTSSPLTVTVDDIINKVNANDAKIQDIKADITMTSNAPFLAPVTQLKIWQKADKQKVEEISPTPQVKIRPPLQTSTENVTMQREIISYNPSTNVYVIKTKQTGQIEEYPYQMDYVDYNKGVTLKTEYYSKGKDDTINLYTIEDSDFVQINGVWVFTKETKMLYKDLSEVTHTTTSVYSNMQVNSGIPDGEFQ